MYIEHIFWNFFTLGINKMRIYLSFRDLTKNDLLKISYFNLTLFLPDPSVSLHLNRGPIRDRER